MRITPMSAEINDARRASKIRQFWFPILKSTDLKKRKTRPVKMFEEPLLLFRGESGRVYCCVDICPHWSTPLSLGSVRGESIQCSMHHWEYDGRHGGCTRIPLYEREIPKSACVETYPVQEFRGFIWVWLGTEDGMNNDFHELWTGDFGIMTVRHKEFGAGYEVAMGSVHDPYHVFHLHRQSLVVMKEPYRFTSRKLNDREYCTERDGKLDTSYRFINPTMSYLVSSLLDSGRVKIVVFATPISKTSSFNLGFVMLENPSFLDRLRRPMWDRMFQKLIVEDAAAATGIQRNLDAGSRFLGTATHYDRIAKAYFDFNEATLEEGNPWFNF